MTSVSDEIEFVRTKNYVNNYNAFAIGKLIQINDDRSTPSPSEFTESHHSDVDMQSIQPTMIDMTFLSVHCSATNPFNFNMVFTSSHKRIVIVIIVNRA